jgi:hypothetical protein
VISKRERQEPSTRRWRPSDRVYAMQLRGLAGIDLTRAVTLFGVRRS